MPTERSPGSGLACDALRARLFEAASRLVTRCGADVTLAEIVHLARESAAPQHHSIGPDVIVESLLEQRLGDLVAVVRFGGSEGFSATSRPGVEWTRAVREILSGELDRPDLSLRTAARTLAVSVRTLQRRLAEEGTGWRAELDGARRERAARLLRQGTATDVTAAHVGYSGRRALRRALRRWDREQADAPGPQVDVCRPPGPSGRLA